MTRVKRVFWRGLDEGLAWAYEAARSRGRYIGWLDRAMAWAHKRRYCAERE